MSKTKINNKKSRKIKVTSYNTYSNSPIVKIITNPIAQILIIVVIFFVLHLTGVVRFFQIGLGAK